MVRKKIWTEEEFARLKSMIEAGASAQRIALALKRPKSSVRNRARELGMPFRHERELARERKEILETTNRI